MYYRSTHDRWAAFFSATVEVFGLFQPRQQENDSHPLLLAPGRGYRLPRAASMSYLTPTISHGKRVFPYVRGRRVHDGPLRDLARLPLWATTPKSGLPPTPTGLRIRGRHRTAWLARMLLWY